MTRVKTLKEIENMRESGRMLKSVLDYLEDNLEAGMSGNDIDAMARKQLKGINGKPAFLDYHGFPAVICVSINDEVVHGIPDDRKLKEGDIVGLDFGIDYRGMITDSARTIAVGRVDKKVEKLIKSTEQALYAGIDTLKHGVRVGDVAEAIQSVLDGGGYGIVRDLVGHGVGHELHEEPNIPNFGIKGTGPILKKGMTVAIEPMATLGDWRLRVDEDKWTIRTADGSLAAHFEHTVLITDDGCEILT